MFEIIVASISAVITITIVIAFVVMGKKNKKLKMIYERRFDSGFISKNTDGIHVKYVFNIPRINPEYQITITDKKELMVFFVGDNKIINCTRKTIDNQKYGRLLLDYFNEQLKNWTL